jgi:periplasmic mercuric ion binding protein
MKSKSQILSVIAMITIVLLGMSFIQTKPTSKYVEIKINVSSQCETCKETLEKAMAYEKGVKSAVLDVATHTFTVVYDSNKTSPDTIRKAISKVGYDADNVPADPKAYEKLPKCCKKGGKH